MNKNSEWSKLFGFYEVSVPARTWCDHWCFEVAQSQQMVYFALICNYSTVKVKYVLYLGDFKASLMRYTFNLIPIFNRHLAYIVIKWPKGKNIYYDLGHKSNFAILYINFYEVMLHLYSTRRNIFWYYNSPPWYITNKFH